MDFDVTDDQALLRESVSRMMERHAPPEYVRRLDREQEYPYDLYSQWAQMGLLRLPFPEEYGGVGGDAMDLIIVAEELSRRSFDFFSAYGGSMFCGLNLLKNGSEEQRRHWLPKLTSGEVRMSISISEPDAGSDVGSIRTSARLDNDQWVLNGQKTWATGAGAKGNIISIYVKTDPTAHYRSGISMFLLPNDAPGLTLRKLDMLGRRCVGTYEMFLDDVRLPQENLVGGVNRGWNCLLSGLQIERVTAAAGYCGGAQAVLDLALSYAKERKQFGRSIAGFQAIAHMLADMQTDVEVARTMVWRAAWALRKPDPDALKIISMAKLFASETYVRAAANGMQIFGGAGYNMEFDMQRHFRDSRSSTIAAGSSQVQRNLIAGTMGVKVQ